MTTSLGVASGISVAIGLACVIVLHLVRRDLSPIEDRISEYALGRSGPLMFIAFVATGIGILCLAWALWRVGGRWSRAVPALLAVAGVGMIVSGLFPTDRLRSGAAADAVHSRASALGTIALVAGALMWSVLRAGRHRVDIALAVLAAGFAAASSALHGSSISGLSQRLLWLTLLLWLIVSALTLPARMQRVP